MSKKLLMLMAALLLFGFGSASAFPLFPGTATDPGTQFEDDNLDYFLDLDGNGLISVGDVLYSAVEFVQVLDLVGSAPDYILDRDADELVAFATIQVTSMNGVWTYGEYNDTPIVQVYSGGAINLDWSVTDPTKDQALAAIIDGTHLWDFSITDDPDTYWSFTPSVLGANDPSVVKGLLSTTKVGVANYQLNQVWGDDIFAQLKGDFTGIGGDGFVDLAGSGDILGGRGLTSGDGFYAFARSDVDVLVNPVPEPSTFALVGAGLIGIGVLARRRRNSK